MSVLVYIENVEGKFKKSAFEVLSFGSAIASSLKLPLIALSIGDVKDDELLKAGKYGAIKILSTTGEKLQSMNVQPYTSVVAQAANAEGATVIVMSASFSGKAIAARVAIKLNAALGENVIDLPEMSAGFVIKKGAYSGKAFAFVELLSDKKVISMMPNSYKVVEQAVQTTIVPFSATIEEKDLKMTVKETVRSTDKVSLPDAEIVVSAGRGMKGP